VRLLAAISAGGVVGALARYALLQAWPGSPWTTLAINVSGSLLLGVLMVVVTEVAPHRRLLRPFLGVGVLGGYTTFSAYVLDAVRAGSPVLAFTYLALSVVGGLAGVWAGVELTRRAVR
jgi:CrcB protein